MVNLNEEEILRIAEFLPFSDLLTIRSLSSVWNSAVKRKLGKRAEIFLNFECTQQSLDQLERIALDTNDFEIITNLNISIYELKEGEMKHYFEQCRSFFTKKVPAKIKKLIFDVKTVDLEGVRLLVDILLHFSSFLENLTLSPTFSEEMFDYAAELLANAKFPNVTYFKLQAFKGVENFCRVFYSAAPNIEELCIGNMDKRGSGNVAELNALLNSEDKTRNSLLPKLYHLDILGGFEEEASFFENFPQKFTKLSIRHSGGSFLNVVLRKNKIELETLSLICIIPGLEFRLPSCANLKNLEISMLHINCENKFSFESSTVVYSVDFPKLKTLRVKNQTLVPNSGGDEMDGCMGPIYETLFPQENDQICESLRLLELPLKTNCKARKCIRDGECDGKFRHLAQTRLVKIFPNGQIIFVT